MAKAIMRKFLKIALTGISAIIVLGVIGFFSIESYWPFQPYIDTKFAANFNENNFNEIQNGTSTNEVSLKLGAPIWKIGCGGCWEPDYYSVNGVIRVPLARKCDAACNAEDQLWQFSDDGACTWWDFAWKDFSLNIHNGKVTQKFAIWHYD